jgi:hypothetical protein
MPTGAGCIDNSIDKDAELEESCFARQIWRMRTPCGGYFAVIYLHQLID